MEKVELDTKHITLRYILFAVCCIVALFAIWYAVSSMLKTETGWQKVTVNSTDEMSISGSLTLYYNIGKSGKAPRTEVRELSSLYTEQAARAWKIVSATESFSGVGNLQTVNAHPNETVTVEPELYQALSELQAVDRLWLLSLAPCYDLLESTAAAATDEEAKLTDPLYSEDAKSVFRDTMILISEPEHMTLQLLGDCKVRLSVSQAYLQAEGAVYLDFGWLRNAVAVEMISDALIEQGFTYGLLASDDGFIRNFDDSDGQFAANLYGKAGTLPVISASLQYHGPQSMVLFSAVPFLKTDAYRMHTYENGEVRTTYIGESGRLKPAMDSLLLYSGEKSVVKLAARYVTEFIADEINVTELKKLPRIGVQAVWTAGTEVFYTEEEAILGNLYENGTVSFRLSLVK